MHSLAVDSGNLELSQRIGTGNDTLRGDLITLQNKLLKRSELKIDLASTGARQSGSLFNGTDAGLPLRRYLEELPSTDHPWAGASDIEDILSIHTLQVSFAILLW